MRPYACAAVLAATLATGACTRGGPSSSPPAEDAAHLFARACAKCHGDDGSGGLPTVPGGLRPIDLRQRGWQESRTDEEIAAAIRHGRGAMPPFADVLTGEQVAALTQYVRQLGTSATNP